MKNMEIIWAYLAQLWSFKTLKVVFSSITMWLSFLFWDVSMPVIACAVLYLSDMFLGLTINAYKWTFSWEKLRKGIFKFIIYGGAIIVWHMLDLIFVHTTPDFWARYVIILYLGVTEWLSVLKHLASVWLHIPLKLINRLEGIRDDLNSPWLEPTQIVKMTTTSESQSSTQTETVVEVSEKV